MRSRQTRALTKQNRTGGLTAICADETANIAATAFCEEPAGRNYAIVAASRHAAQRQIHGWP